MTAQYPVFEAELEKSLREDSEGKFLHEVQRSLREYIAAVEIHMRSGLDATHYVQWRDLQKAAETASQAAEEVHQLLHDKQGQ